MANEDTKVVEEQTSNETPLSESEKEQVQEIVQNNQQITQALGNLTVRKIQLETQEAQLKLGQVSVQRILLNQQLDDLNKRESDLQSKYVEIQQQEQDLVKKLNEKYGPGQLDPESGVFTPNNS